MALASLPSDVLGIILGELVRRKQPVREYTPSFPELQAEFLGRELVGQLGQFGRGHPEWKVRRRAGVRTEPTVHTQERFQARPRYALTVDVARALELALVCKAFFRALRRLPDVRRELFRLDCCIGLFGTSYDADCYPYFPARFCSEDHHYLKEVVDMLGHGLPCERAFELDGKYVNVAFLNDFASEILKMCDGFIFFYDFRDPDSLNKLRIDYIPGILEAKGWDKLRNSVLVSSHNRSLERLVTVAAAEAFATAFGIQHFSIQVSQRLGSEMTPEQQNVKEVVYAVARQIRPKEVILAPSGKERGKERKKCAIM
jgi:hypothetical protein